jgi:DNA polymerase elongation subunit (family B)
MLEMAKRSEDVTSLQLINTQSVGFNAGQKIMYIEKVNNKKQMRMVNKPTITFYHSKPEFASKHIKEKPRYVPSDEITPITVPYKDLFVTIMELIDQLDDTPSFKLFCDHYNAVQDGRKRKNEMKELHAHPCIFQSDIDIADFHVGKYKSEAGELLDQTSPLVKAFSDIEVNNTDYEGFPDEELAPCEIDSISIVLGEPYNTLFLFLLRNPENPQIAEYENNGGVERVSKKLLTDYPLLEEVKHFFFDKELDLLVAYFHLVNEDIRPDTISFWNMKFDARTIQNRLLILEGEGADAKVMCPEDMQKVSKVFYWEDTKAKDLADKKDSFTITSYTNWIDQMLTYASIRKTGGKKDSYALDDILEEEIGQGKVDMQGSTIRTLRVDNYELYVEYSSVDSLGLWMLELKVCDFDTIYSLSLLSNTRFQKARTKTVTLKMMAVEFLNSNGVMISNNTNMLSLGCEKVVKTHKFKGAFVADPSLVMKGIGEAIYGVNSDLIFKSAIDFDFKALYPSIMISGNMDPSCLFGKLVIFGPSGTPFVNPDIPEDEAPVEYIQEFMNTYISDCNIATGSIWMGLPNEEELLDLMFQ